MTVFDDLFQEAGLPALLEQFGERIEYHPLDGRPRVITAIVKRDPPQDVPGVNRAVAPFVVITALDDPIRGISLTAIDTGGDKIKVSRRKGGIAELLSVTRVSKQTGGITVEVS